MENEQVISDAGPTVSHELPEEKFTEEQLATIQGWADEGDWAEGLADDGALSQEPTTDVFGDALTPSDYVFDVAPTGLQPLDIRELKQVQTAMAAAGIPAVLGNALAKEWNRHLAAGPVAEATLKLSAITARQELNRRHGEPKAADMLRIAKDEIAKVSKSCPWIIAGLTDTEYGNSIFLVETLLNIHQARNKVS
jgi:hypothetical protein